MAAQAQGIAGAPAATRPAVRGPSEAELLSRRSLRPGVRLACAYGWLFAMGALIDVSADGKAMMLIGSTFLATVLVCAVVHPRWYLPLVVAYLPFSRAYPLPVAGLTGANMTNFLMAAGLLAWLVSRQRQRPRLRFGATERLAVLFVAVASLSVIPAYLAEKEPVELLLSYRTWVAPILFYFLARGLVRDREDVRGILQVLVWTAFLVAACTWKEGIDRGDRGSIDSSRVAGLMQQANSMGAFLAYYGVPLLAFAVTARPRRRGLPYLLAFLVAARAVLFTFSRGAYLSLMAGSATVLLFGNPLVLATAGGGGLLAAAAFPTLIPDSVRARMGESPLMGSFDPGREEPTSTLDKSSALRVVIWRGALRMIAAHPLQGVGVGRFGSEITEYADYQFGPEDPRDAHNAYLLVAAEMGLPSAALLLLLFAAWGAGALRIYFRGRHPIDRRLSLVFLGTLAGVLVSCTLGSRFSDEALIGGFWILAALVGVVARLRPPLRVRGLA